jgi:hypothetical protein
MGSSATATRVAMPLRPERQPASLLATAVAVGKRASSWQTEKHVRGVRMLMRGPVIAVQLSARLTEASIARSRPSSSQRSDAEPVAHDACVSHRAPRGHLGGCSVCRRPALWKRRQSRQIPAGTRRESCARDRPASSACTAYAGKTAGRQDSSADPSQDPHRALPAALQANPLSQVQGPRRRRRLRIPGGPRVPRQSAQASRLPSADDAGAPQARG